MKRSIFAAMLLCLTVVEAFAQGPNGSKDYYAPANGKSGEALKTAMYQIIKLSSPAPISYDGLKTAYVKTDKRADGYLRDWYSNITKYEPGGDMGGNSSEGAGWNREHLVPQSWFNEAAPMKSDIMHVVPTDAKINNMRSSYPLAEVGTIEKQSANGYSLLGACKTPGYTGKVFEPNDEIKGDIARIYFYMATCYQDKITNWSGGLFTGTTYQPFAQWYLTMLMRWSKQDPVDEVEIARNNAVYSETAQKNRNPFVDYPGLEDYVWGDKKTEAFSYDNYGGTSTYVAAPTFTPAGGTSFTESISVTISCATDGATVHYTLDGSTPTTSSTPYSGSAITLTETTTVKAIACDSEGNSSSVATAKYTKGSAPLEGNGTFIFNTDEGLRALGITKPAAGAGNEISSMSLVSGGITLTSTNGSTPTRVWNSSGTTDLRVYKDGGSLTFTSEANIVKIVFEGSEVNVFGSSLSNGVWTGSNKSVTFTATGTAKISTITVTTEAVTPQKQDVTLSFSASAAEATLGETFTAPTLSVDPIEAASEVVYSSSDESVATVDASTGEVILIGAGTTIITATFAGNDEYNPGSDSYELVVSEEMIVGDNKYKLIKDASKLAAGDVIILANISGKSGYALSTNQKTNNREATNDLTVNSDGTLTPGEAVQLITLEKDGGNYLFNVGNGYLYAASSSNNYLKTSSTSNNNCKAAIAIDQSSGNATITFQGAYSRNSLRFNANNGAPLFSCYESTSTLPLPQIYKKVIPETITLTVSSVGYATTYYSDKNLTVPAGVEAYTYKVVDGQLQESKRYEKGDVIPQGTGVVLKAAEGSYDFEVSDEGGLVDTDNLLRGTDEPTTISDPGYKYYMLSLNAQSDPNSVGFYWGKNSENGTKISNGAHKAYLAVPTGESTTGGNAGAKSFFPFNEADITDGIDNVQSAEFNAPSTEIYNLNGQRVNTPQRGIYIVNGRKVVVK